MLAAFCSGQPARACQELPLVSAWLQHLLRTSSVQSSSGSSIGSVDGSRSYRTQAAADSEQQQQQQPQQQARPLWKQVVQQTFSVRPSVLSPLHALHREAEEIEQRLQLLEHTMTAHIKLADELQPSELEAAAATAAGADDPVPAALASRAAQLSAARDAYDRLSQSFIAPCRSPEGLLGYYTVLEMQLANRDRDAAPFQAVVDGNTSVWEYWLKSFAPKYHGLPGLGSIESLYNIRDDDDLLRERMAGLASSAPRPPPQPIVDSRGRARSTGGRKTSSAQVYVWRGQGRILVNGRPLDDYFGDLLMRSYVLRPLNVAGLVGQVDVLATVNGGGVSGQAQATAHGIAKALRRLDPALKPVLKAAGLLRRDPRAVERKKPGKAKARKSFAWVKR